MPTSHQPAPTPGDADDPRDPTAPAAPRKRAGAFDIRSIIGGLIGLYGILLLVMGLFFTDEAELRMSDGVNLNLWTGVGLLVGGLIFLSWVRLRPLEVPAETPVEREDASS